MKLNEIFHHIEKVNEFSCNIDSKELKVKNSFNGTH